MGADQEFTAQKRVDRVKKFVGEFHANNDLVKPDPNSEEQTTVAKELASAISAFDSAQTSLEHAKMFDEWAIAKREVRVFHAIVECDKLIVKAKALGMIPPDGGTLRKLAECEEKRADLESKLNQAGQRISNLENLLHLHGIAIPRRDTFEGDVG